MYVSQGIQFHARNNTNRTVIVHFLRLSKMKNTLQHQIKNQDLIIHNEGDIIKKSKKKFINNNNNYQSYLIENTQKISIINKEPSLEQGRKQDTNTQDIQEIMQLKIGNDYCQQILIKYDNQTNDQNFDLNFNIEQSSLHQNAHNQESQTQFTNMQEFNSNQSDFINSSTIQNKESLNIQQIQAQKEEQSKQLEIQLIYSTISMLNQGNFLKQQDNKTIKDISNQLVRQNYFVKEYLTSGGEGDIFVGEQNNLQGENEKIIFKIYTNLNLEQFEEELKIMNSIKNPINIVKIKHHIKFEEHQIYIQIQEKCKFSLSDELKQFTKMKTFTISQLCYIIFDLLDGLIELRSHNIIHQDIKPQNILKTNSGIYIYSDFGCASWKYNQFKINGYTKGFNAPVQTEDNKEINYQSDVYCLGNTFKKVIECFYEINQSINNQQTDLVSKFLSIINNMVMRDNQDREEVIKLLLAFYQSINYFIYEDINKWYNNKILKIIDLDPFNNDKDTHYFSFAHLQYSLIHFHTQLIITKKNEAKIFNSIDFNFNQIIEKVSILDQKLIDIIANLGNCYKQLGYYEKALNFHLKSLEMKQIIYQWNDYDIAISLNYVGQCYQKLGYYEKALDFHLKSLEMVEIIFQGNHSTIANVGSCYQKLGQNEKSLDFHLKSQEMEKIIFQGNHLNIATYLNSVGSFYQKLGQYEEALEFHLKSIEMVEIICQGNHSKFDFYRNNVELCYQKLGQYEIALNFHLQTLEMIQIIFNGNHSDISLILNNIGLCYLKLGQYEKALDFLLKSLEMEQIIFKYNHPDIPIILNNIGLCYQKLGQYEKALNFHLQSLVMMKIIFNGNCFDISLILNSIGMCYLKLGQLEKEFNFNLKSLEMAQIIFKGNHSDIALFLNNVGSYYQELGQYEKALNFHLQSLEMAQIIFKGNHSAIAMFLNCVGSCYQELGLYEKALKFHQKSLEMKQIIYKGNHSTIAISLNNVGQCYQNLGKI